MQETFIKYLAGLLDADGTLCFAFVKSRDEKTSTLTLHLKLTSSDNVDESGFVASLPALTGLGYVHRFQNEVGTWFTGWHLASASDFEKLLPRVIKHMVIKARHWQWLLETWRERKNRKYGTRFVMPEERESIRKAAKLSRDANVGPVKPKNHPTWAWLAGYLDGDGCYTYDLKAHKGNGTCRYMRVWAVARDADASVLHFIHRSFGGKVTDHSQTANCKIWYRNLGPSERSFALRFLPNLAKHSRLKRHKIERLIAHHQQRLTALAPAGEVIV